MINIHLNALQELIDKYKESLSNAKDLYEYQKNIADQTKNITSLEKQLAAYEGDDSEETRATVQRLRKQLQDAQNQLKETEWDKYISETEKFLDDMYNDYEELLNKRLEDIDALMHDMITDSNENWEQGRWAINHVAADVAYKITDPMKTIIDSNGNITSDFAKKFEDSSAATLTEIQEIKKSVDEIKDKTVEEAVNAKKIAGTKYNGMDYKDVFNISTYMKNNPDLVKKFGDNYSEYLKHFVEYGMKEGRVASSKFNLDVYKNNNPDLVKKFGKDPKNNYKYYEHYIKYGKKEGRKAYAKGTRNIPYDQLAWTQEEGTELIFRKSDGAMLTPLGAGDKVFTKEMTDNLYDFAKASVKVSPFIPESTFTGGNDVDISIAVDKVVADNPEQFARQLIQTLKNNPKAENIIQEMTLGQAMGNGKLNKRKY